MPTKNRTRRLQHLAAILMVGSLVPASHAGGPGESPAFTLSKRIEANRSLLWATPGERRRYAVFLARGDRLRVASSILEAMHRAYPEDASVLHDLISVLSWQEQHQRVMQLSEKTTAETAPGFALEALARSARSTGQYAAAEKWYLAALNRDPDRLEPAVGLALTHADSGGHERAREVFLGLPPGYRNSIDGMLVDAYLWQARGDPLMAFLAYSRVLDRHPENRDALRGKLRALQDSLLPQQALTLAARHPGLASRDEIQRLEADRAALMVRSGEVSPFRGTARFRDTDRALAQLRANILSIPPGTELAQVTRFDMILALRDRAQYGAAIAAYAGLNMDDEALPAYVLHAVAGALLMQRQPAEALRLYDIAVGKAPGDFQLSIERFYALVELERHAEAIALSDQLADAQDIWLTTPGSRVIKPNPRRLKAEIARALARAYADQLATSQAMLAEMLEEAPHNTDIRQELGSVYRWRGWPRKAAFQYRQVLTVEPDLMSARVGYANALLDLGQHELLRSKLQALVAEEPEEPGVRRLLRRNELQNRREITVAATAGDSSGEQFGSRHHQADVSIHLHPLNDAWRPYVLLHDASAEFSEGDARRRRAGLGIEYRRPDHRVMASATASTEGDARPGLSLGYTWALSDFWQLEGQLETETQLMPLRGYRVGVDASRLHLGARYRFSELSEMALGADLMDFSDGNRRSAWQLNGRKRILNLPDWKIDLAASLYTSRNDLAAVSYFSPSSDRSASVSLDSQWRLFRRYERSFSHRLGMTAGRYGQEGFAAGYVGNIEYQQMVQVSDALELYYGVRRSRALYDGNFEYGTFFTGGLRGRF